MCCTFIRINVTKCYSNIFFHKTITANITEEKYLKLYLEKRSFSLILNTLIDTQNSCLETSLRLL